jgi:hypothetical protein
MLLHGQHGHASEERDVLLLRRHRGFDLVIDDHCYLLALIARLAHR